MIKTNQKGIIQILLVVGIVAVVGLIGYLLFIGQKQNKTAYTFPFPSAYQSQYNQGTQNVSPISDSGDLNKTSASLDATDTTQIDTELNKLNSDSSSF